MNRLAQSHSPYLLQHQTNPVDWWPWCDEAFERAQAEDRPVFLSIGYAACHWCHVMEHESFENESIAKFLNENFVSIKVDREERPDIDSIYMNAVQLMTGRGGWPMSVFLDHGRRPFYAGTYWPPATRSGMPGFAQVLDAIVDAWKNRRDDVVSHSEEMTDALGQLAHAATDASASPASPETLHAATVGLIRSVDSRDGGFGAAPKFPHATDLMWLIRCQQYRPDQAMADAITLTLDRMAAGGIRDHVGGGFSRYSVDAQWLVPHFEKMLYDNALLAIVYTRASQTFDQPEYQAVAIETLDYMARELTDPSGGLHCSEDADSEGVEGKFYVWTPSEIEEVLGSDDANVFGLVYDITDAGNFEGSNIPNLPKNMESWAETLKTTPETLRLKMAEFRERLRLARQTRIAPGRDDKILADWNALAARAFAIAGGVIDARYTELAIRIGNFLRQTMTRQDGRLWHAHRRGHSHIDGFLDDYAFTIQAMVALYESTADASWIESAVGYAHQLLEDFEDPQVGGFFATSSSGERLITRQKEWHDSSLVSGNAAAATGLMKLASITGNERFADAARRTLAAGGSVIESQPAAVGALVEATDQFHRGARQWIVALADHDDFPRWLAAVNAKYRPDVTLVWRMPDHDASSSPLGPAAAQAGPVDGQVSLYECQNQTCSAPIVGEAAVNEYLTQNP